MSRENSPLDQQDQERERATMDNEPTAYVGEEMTLTEHLRELRSRLIKAVIGVVIGMGISGIFVKSIFRWLEHQFLPKDVGPVQALTVLEVFTTYIKIALICGMALSLPIILYQIVAFISPGLTRKERTYFIGALPLVSLFFAGGVAFGIFLVLPNALRVLLHMGGTDIAVNLRVTDFVSFVVQFLFALGLVFLTPFAVYILVKLRIVSAGKLARVRKYAFLVILIVAAILTPTPDPVNLMIVAIPMYLLYELGILFARIF